MPRKKGEEIVHAEPGEISAIVAKNLELASWPEIDTYNVEEMQQRCIKYFEWCVEKDDRPTVEGLALSIGIRRKTLWEWYQKETHGADISNTLKKAMTIIDKCMADYAVTGKINPVMAIFLMKNNHGYTDHQEIVITPQNALGEGTPQKELEERYMQSIVLDAEQAEIVDAE